MASPLVIRVRTPERMIRLSANSTETIADIQRMAAKELGVQVSLSRQATGGATLQPAATLSSLGFATGELIYARATSGGGAAASTAASPSAPSSSASAAGGSRATIGKDGVVTPAAAPTGRPAAVARVLTPRCQHGAGGACHHCDPPSAADYAAKAGEPLNKAGRYAPRHLETSAAPHTGDGALSGELEWLCRHAPDAMCVNCAPLQKGDKVELAMLCQHGPGARCTNCLPPDTTVEGRKFISRGEWEERKKLRCEHAFNASCVNCAPPPILSYKSRATTCGRHAPWPRGICLDCTAPAVDLALQPYRSVDYIQVHNFGEMSALIALWDANAATGLQRAGLLYGSYRPDPNFRHGVKAVVEAIYEPPQAMDATAGVVQLLPDPQSKAVAAVTAALGLEPIGWLFTRPPTRVSKSQPPLTPAELFAVASQQLAHPGPALPSSGGSSTARSAPSRFVSLVIARNAAAGGAIEPQGFMASEQLVALVRDDVLARPTASDSMIRIRAAQGGEPPLPEVIRKDAVRGRWKSNEFEPEFATITLEVGRGTDEGGAAGSAPGSGGGPLFRHATFPVENREVFGTLQSAAAIRTHLSTHRNEPLHHRLSDFHAILYLAKLLDVDTAVAVAEAVRKGTPFAEGLELIMGALQASR